MSSNSTDLSHRYPSALRRHLKQDSSNGKRLTESLGKQALAEGLDTLDVARIHERAMTEIMKPGGMTAAARKQIVARASRFFANTMTPIEQTHPAATETRSRLNEIEQTLKKNTRELAASNQRFEREVVRCKRVEASLKKSMAHYTELLDESKNMQKLMRYLSHRIITGEEAERKKISRELHDRIAQTLAGINVQLAALKQEALAQSAGLADKIDSTQRIVTQSVNIVHRFARELRPTVLDDLGLNAALKSYIKEFTQQTKIPVHFVPIDGPEQLSDDQRTVLYRVAQAALTNVAQHAKAKQVSVSLTKSESAITMEIIDDGKGFNVERVLYAKRFKRLGVIGMRERVEMVRGQFTIKSAPGKGTGIQARIPYRKNSKRKTPEIHQ